MSESHDNAIKVNFSVSEILFSTGFTFECILSPKTLESDLYLVIDIYNLDNPVHPDGHLGWWQFPANTLSAVVSCTFTIRKGVFDCTLNGKGPSHHWVNDLNVPCDRLVVNAVLRMNITNAILYLDKVPAFKRKKDLLSFRGAFSRDWTVPKYANSGYVFPREGTVRIVSRNIFPRDAVGNLCLEIFRMLRQNNIPSEIYAENTDLSLNDIIRRVDRLANDSSPDDLLFYSFSTYDPSLEMMLELTFGRRILYFHGVTRPELLQVFDPELSVTCRKASSQFGVLQKFDLIASNSRTTARTLISGFEKTSMWEEDDIHILPPRLFSKNSLPQVDIKSFKEETSLLYVGRIKSHKKIEDLLGFFSEYLELDPSANLWVVGGGADKAYWDYLKWIETSQLKIPFGKVHWIGSVSDAELAERYATASAYVSMSEDEGFCLPILEAMLAGLPIFSYGLPAIREVLMDSGLYFLKKDHKYLAVVLHGLLSNPTRIEELISKQRERAIKMAKEMDGRGFLRLIEPQ